MTSRHAHPAAALGDVDRSAFERRSGGLGVCLCRCETTRADPTSLLQFAKFMSVIKTLGTRVEQEHMKHLAELKRLEESSGAGANGSLAAGAGAGPANSGLGAIAAAEVTDFESLVRGSVNGQKVNGLAARGNQVDIFADVSPAPSPAPQFGYGSSGAGGPSAQAATVASPQSFTSTGGHFQPPPASSPRPGAPNRLGSTPSLTPTPRAPLGARPLAPSSSPTAHATSSFVNPPPAAGPSTTSAPASGLKSFAPLQPRPNSASSSSSRTVTSASFGGGGNQPNYNLSLSTTSGGLPPLQPTTSSLFPQSAASNGALSPSTYGAPPPPSNGFASSAAPSASAVQWNRFPSLSSPGPTPGFSQPAPHQALPSPSRPQPGTAGFPPGYNPSGALLPNSSARSPAAGPPSRSGAGAGKGGTMDFGAWADLDPLK